MKTIKENLKTEAKELRRRKDEIRTMMKNHRYCGKEQWSLIVLRKEWRHKFIAYCLLKGRNYDEIEQTVREDNKPDQRLIDKYLEEFRGD
tara:strand:- start:25762 stop:26031 length:270 start_codon:yes stop_codon:yes gene_type:complete